MYKDVEITILESKALIDIRAIHKNTTSDAVFKFLAVDDILIRLDKDIKKLKR